MPISTEALWISLGAEGTLGKLSNQKISEVANWGQLQPGTTISKGAILFPRLPDVETNG
jgi:methionyl-tRNA synthetase